MTPASLDELLKEWEVECAAYQHQILRHRIAQEYANRIISLIAVVRAQREALEDITVAREDFCAGIAEEALTDAERILKG